MYRYSVIERVSTSGPEMVQTMLPACPLNENIRCLNGIPYDDVLYLFIAFAQRIIPGFGLSDAIECMDQNPKIALSYAARQYRLENPSTQSVVVPNGWDFV